MIDTGTSEPVSQNIPKCSEIYQWVKDEKKNFLHQK